MTLRQKQCLFTKLIGQLIAWSYSNGYELTFGDAYRTPQQASANAQAGTGVANSNHTRRLAIDFNLFVNGEYRTSTEDYRPLGEFWKSLSTADCECAWGGDFHTRPDGNHFSVEHEGVR